MRRASRIVCGMGCFLLMAAASVAAAAPPPPATQPAFRTRIDVEPHDVKGSTWELKLPKGHYVVRLFTRDSAKVRDFNDAHLQGKPLLAGASAMNRVASSFIALADVPDGLLTLRQVTGDLGAVLRSVEVEEARSPLRLISWHTIGYSSKTVADRCVGRDIKRIGWTGFVRRAVQPELEWGCRRVVLHNPFGCLPDENMQFDQVLHAE